MGRWSPGMVLESLCEGELQLVSSGSSEGPFLKTNTNGRSEEASDNGLTSCISMGANQRELFWFVTELFPS
eukprot:CAMPEP_0172428452 /NCGR_PEP_ID=MMETSP1064-20121228/46391_1 /TAXON_ID=202472 /ORGANISM="Aulacoseira subarctica , Strain CCAP 1002/5" /LENGTH=70 /DNA_ID=CAMNT_0013173245 /DNA_START=38 /DNA_END=247 /DNA_ORIENTATION=-